MMQTQKFTHRKKIARLLIAGKKLTALQIAFSLETVKGSSRIGELDDEGFPINKTPIKSTKGVRCIQYSIPLEKRSIARKLFKQIYKAA